MSDAAHALRSRANAGPVLQRAGEGRVAGAFASDLDSMRDRHRLHAPGRIFSASCGSLRIPATYLLAGALLAASLLGLATACFQLG